MTYDQNCCDCALCRMCELFHRHHADECVFPVTFSSIHHIEQRNLDPFLAVDELLFGSACDIVIE